MLLAHRGKVDEWRVARVNTWSIVSSMGKQRVSMVDAIPLPYDEELEEHSSHMSDQELYEQGKVFRMPGVNYG